MRAFASSGASPIQGRLCHPVGLRHWVLDVAVFISTFTQDFTRAIRMYPGLPPTPPHHALLPGVMIPLQLSGCEIPAETVFKSSVAEEGRQVRHQAFQAL